MFIELDKYCWNSLRKGRVLGFQNDVEEAFTVFKNHTQQHENITIAEFQRIAQTSQFQFITKCRSEQQDEQEYIQLLYQILIDNYFMTRNEAKQVFSVYGLYFLYCQLERKRRINVDMNFLDEFLVFLRKNGSKADKEWMIVAKKLMQSCVSIGIKAGLKTYLIKPNGEPARKGRYVTVPSKKVENKEEYKSEEKQEEKQFISNLKGQFSSLEVSLENYCKGKQKLNSQLSSSQTKLIFSDKNLGIRLLKKYNQYERLLTEKQLNEK